MSAENRDNPIVFLDIKIGKAKAGRIIIELFKNVVPKTVENFRALCTGEKGIGRHGRPLHLKGTIFHRVVPIFMVQGGDIIVGDGTGGESIYGDKFPDENFTVLHDVEGRVGMANNGEDTNNSQFYITSVPCSHLDGINVAFGTVRKGLNIIQEMAELPRNEADYPLEKIVIENCGELKPGESWCIGEIDGTQDIYPPWPNDWDINSNCDHKIIVEAINKIKNSGNYFYDNNNYIDSERKYKKTLRYIDWFIGIDKNYRPQQVGVLRLNSILNLAAVKIRRHCYKEAIDLCNQVIAKEPNNGKALYRRAQARLALKDFDKALVDLYQAINLHPNDKHIESLLSRTRKDKLEYLKREKRIFANLFKY